LGLGGRQLAGKLPAPAIKITLIRVHSEQDCVNEYGVFFYYLHF